jgi:hypothetical protein
MNLMTALLLSSILIAMWKVYGIRRRFKEIDMTVDRWHRELIESFENSVIRVKVEKYEDTFFLYRENTMEYVCSGRNKTEIEENFLERFPNNIISIEDGDEEIVRDMLN